MMLSDEELEALLLNGESDRVERKASASDSDKIRQAICAFANDLPGHGKTGVIFVGVNDDGSCSNLAISDDLLLLLSQMREQVQPFPTIRVSKRNLTGCDVAVVEVDPSEIPPVRFDGRTWIRVGPRRAVASPDEERQLIEKRRSRARPFDIQPVHGSVLEDLDLEFFRREYLNRAYAPDVIERNSRGVEQQLAALGFATPDGVPTNAGILVLGKAPKSWIGGAYIQFARFDGVTLSDPIKDQKELSGPLHEVLRYLDEILRLNISVALEVGQLASDVKHPDYPLGALQQLVRNAVLHRNFEGTNAPVRLYWFFDRIEIHNPGGPYGQVNLGNFGQPYLTDYRNPVLAEAMKVLGYVQKFGMGIAQARTELANNDNPPPEFQPETNFVLVTVRKRR
jgi:ATP-dependent DNA helicase RecG